MIKSLLFSAVHTCCDVCLGTGKVLVGFKFQLCSQIKRRYLILILKHFFLFIQIQTKNNLTFFFVLTNLYKETKVYWCTWWLVLSKEERNPDLDRTIWMHSYTVHLLSSSYQLLVLVTYCAAIPNRQCMCMDTCIHTHTLPSGQGSAPDWHLYMTSSLSSLQGSSLTNPTSSLGKFVPEKNPYSTVHSNVDRYMVYQARESSVQTCTGSCSHLSWVQKASCLILGLGQAEEATLE